MPLEIWVPPIIFFLLIGVNEAIMALQPTASERKIQKRKKRRIITYTSLGLIYGLYFLFLSLKDKTF